MVSLNHKSFSAADRSYYSLIKRDIQKMVVAAGFNEVKAGRVDIIVSELTSNLSKHALGGEILAGMGHDRSGGFVEIICLDEGPGISDISRVLTDGYSSVSTMGHGLGSVKRLSDQFDVYSLKGWGSILAVRIYKEELPGYQKAKVELSALNVPKPHEEISGDGHCFISNPNGFRVFIADGLGHGPDAREAVRQGCEAFEECREEKAAEIVRYVHNSCRKTRGMVGIVVLYDSPSRKWEICGVGNVALRWISPQSIRNHVCYNGIIGHNIPNTLNSQQVAQEEFGQFIACSDGIRSRWDLSKFPMIQKYHGTVIATAIYKEFSRRTDDVSVIVCKTIES